MFRIDGPGATPDNKFSEGDPASGTRATVVTDDWLNAVQEELAQAIEDDGYALSKVDFGQLSKLLRRRPVYVGSVAEDLAGLAVVEGQVLSATGWHPGSEVGGRDFIGRALQAKSGHDGGSVISPTVPPVSEQLGASLAERVDNFLKGVGETDPGGTGCFVAKYHQKTFFESYGAITGDETAAALNKIVFEHAKQFEPRLYGIPGETYWLPLEVDLSGSCSFYGQWSTLKLAGTTDDFNWLLASQMNGRRFKGFTLDGNRANTPNIGIDRSMLTVFSTEDVDVGKLILTDAFSKGLSVTSSVSGPGTRNIRLREISGRNCGGQCIIIDGTGTPDCEDILIDSVFVRDTDHAGIAINDGSRRVSVTNCILDVNNVVWDALSIRGAQDVTVSNCIGRRGRNGCQVFILDQLALDRGEDARRVTFSNNIWEFNDQNGLLINGAKEISVTGDIARNNAAVGFNVVQKSGVRRASAVTLSSVHAFDNQVIPTQQDGILLQASDTIRVSAPVIYGNVNGNKVRFNTGAPPTDVDVTGEGADGSTHKLVSGSTGVVPANGSTVVSLAFTTAFQIAPNWASATVVFGSSNNNLQIRKITGFDSGGIQIDVENFGGTDQTGTVYAEARLIL